MSGDVFFPGSKIPYSPINPHGRKARYPDGWKSPLREPLFQVYVNDQLRGDIPIGPKVRNDVASQICAAVQVAIKSGKINGWSSPTVVKAPPEQVRWGAV